MLYLNERVEIPEVGTYVMEHGAHSYLYKTIESYYNEKHQQRHRQRVIGRLVTDADGVRRLIPNDNYYRYYNAKKPEFGPVKKSGPERRHPRNREDRTENERSGLGYGLAIMSIMTETGMYSILEELLGKESAMRAAAIIAFYVQCDGSPALTKFPYFMEDHMSFLVDPFDARRVCEEFDRCDETTLDYFVRRWLPMALEDAQEEEHILYDVTSVSTTAENLEGAEFGCNRDHEDLEQINIGLICTGLSKKPLFLAKYDGSINDTSNFNYVLTRCREFGLSEEFDIIYDGGFDVGDIDFSVLNCCGVLTARSHRKYKEVRKALLEHVDQLEQNTNDIFVANGSAVSMLRIPFSMGKTEGSLIMTLDFDKKANQLRTLIEQRNKLKAELEAASACPEKTAKFEKFFTITKDHSRKGFSFKDNARFKEEARLCGTNAFYSTRKTQDNQQDLKDYRAKDVVEKMFNSLKNDLMDGRLYVHTAHTLTGKMFYLFLALIVYKEMEKRYSGIRKGERKWTMDNCFTELKRMRLVKGPDGWQMYQALNSQQKALVKATFTMPEWKVLLQEDN